MRKRTTLAVWFSCWVILAGVSADAAEIEVNFSAEGGCRERICLELEEAKKSIDVMMYYFMSPEIADALIKSAKRDVAGRVILDRCGLIIAPGPGGLR